MLKGGRVLPLIFFSKNRWQKSKHDILSEIKKEFGDISLVVRSSSQQEDSASKSFAGHFLTLLDVHGMDELEAAIDKVFASYVGLDNDSDQVLVQPMLGEVINSGVAFTRDISNNSHYFVINYDDVSGSTESVTSGCESTDLKTLYISKTLKSCDELHSWQKKLVCCLRELEDLFDFDALDVEFALTKEEELFIFQVRPLVLNEKKNEPTFYSQKKYVRQIKNKISSLSKEFPYLSGKKSMFGVMPDWNPAEIIGIRPRPLAFSIYKELITDAIWAESRANYGYKNLHSFPLLVSLGGMPYVDIRVSFNSFIPASLSDHLADKLVNYYINELEKNNKYHDKVEFEIIFSCYTFDLKKRLEKLLEHGFSLEEIDTLELHLRDLTNNIIDKENGLCKKDLEVLEELEKRQKQILSSDLNEIEKIYWLLEDCKKYGSLPFAGLARAGFVAVQLLKSLVEESLITEDDYHSFMASLTTVNTEMSKDLEELDKVHFLKKYGHLRPGTYDILTPSYKEDSEKYFQWEETEKRNVEHTDFFFNLEKLNSLEAALKEHRFVTNVVDLFNFLKSAIEGREYAKFLFSKNISEALNHFTQLGEQFGFDREELSFADISIVSQLYSSTNRLNPTLRWSIDMGKKVYYKVTSNITLPPLIVDERSVEVFELPENEPNFITLKKVVSDVVEEGCKEDIKDKILMIPSADPGYDWIFTHDLKGFITMYGGSNSHMAIRAGELGIPAVIGAGELLYSRWKKAKTLSIDCANQKVEMR